MESIARKQCGMYCIIQRWNLLNGHNVESIVQKNVESIVDTNVESILWKHLFCGIYFTKASILWNLLLLPLGASQSQFTTLQFCFIPSQVLFITVHTVSRKQGEVCSTKNVKHYNKNMFSPPSTSLSPCSHLCLISESLIDWSYIMGLYSASMVWYQYYQYHWILISLISRK